MRLHLGSVLYTASTGCGGQVHQVPAAATAARPRRWRHMQAQYCDASAVPAARMGLTMSGASLYATAACVQPSIAAMHTGVVHLGLRCLVLHGLVPPSRSNVHRLLAHVASALRAATRSIFGTTVSRTQTGRTLEYFPVACSTEHGLITSTANASSVTEYGATKPSSHGWSIPAGRQAHPHPSCV